MKIDDLSDDQLLSGLSFIASGSRHNLAQMVGYLAQVIIRRLHLSRSFTSLHDYCVRGLRMSEGEASRRAFAARMAVQFPSIIDMLKRGGLSLATLRELKDVLTADNHRKVLADVDGMTALEVRKYVAMTRPRGKVPSVIQKSPTTSVTDGNVGQLSKLPSRPGEVIDSVLSDASTCTPSAGEVAIADTLPVSSHSMGEVVVHDESRPPTIAIPAPSEPRFVPPLPRPLSRGKRERRQSRIDAVANGLFRISFAANHELVELLQYARELLHQENPGEEFGPVIKRALEALIGELALARQQSHAANHIKEAAPSRRPRMRTAVDRARKQTNEGNTRPPMNTADRRYGASSRSPLESWRDPSDYPSSSRRPLWNSETDLGESKPTSSRRGPDTLRPLANNDPLVMDEVLERQADEREAHLRKPKVSNGLRRRTTLL